MAGANAVRAAKRKYKGQSGIAGGMPGSRIPAKGTKKRDLLSASAENPPEVDIPDTASPGSTGGKAKRTRKSPVAEEVKVDDALREKGKKIAEQLAALYPQPPIPLVHGNTFQLLVTVMLSAQTTDKKVNEVSPALFKLAPTPKAMATLDVDTIRTLIRQIGLAPTKSKNLSNMSKMLEEEHGGEVPNTFEALEKLPGVGHKTASVVMVQGFGQPAFPVDTHIHRLAARWGLSSGRNVKQTEEDLKNIFEEAMWRDLHLQIIYFGREYCPAQNHDASQCPICSWASVDSSRSSRKAARPKKGTPKKTIKKSSKRE
eukprot:evm.model.scf_1907.2 EVM.evm.TU.scf_1907.2   scf_1907:10091-12804(+)